MALERKLLAVPAQSFTSNGTTSGVLTVDRSDLFKVRQNVVLRANGEPSAVYEIKRIVVNTIHVGPVDNDVDTRSDISAYTVGKNASIFTNEQRRPFIHDGEDPNVPHSVDELEHSEEPALAKRVQIVDGYGESYGPTILDAGVRRLPVDVGGLSLTASGISVDPAPATPTITNVNYTTSGVEQSHALPSDTQKFTIRVRGMDANMRLGFVNGSTSSGPYLTIRRGNSFYEDNLKTSATLYFQVDKSSQVVEILTWN